MATDQEIAREILANGPGANTVAGQLLLHHTAGLRRHVMARGLPPGILLDDVLQDFYFKICRNGFRALAQWQGLTDPGVVSIFPYFCRILDNAVVDAVRRQGRRREVELPGGELHDPEDPSPGPGHEVADRQLREALRYCLEFALSETERAVARRYVAGQSHAEIAAALGIEPGNSRVRLHRALQALKRCIESRERNVPGRRGVVE